MKNDTQIECDSQDLELRISTYAEPDISLNWETINQNIYVINNGKLISFYDEANGQEVKKMSVSTNTNEDSSIYIKIPMSELSGNKEALINIVVDFAPEYVAEKNDYIPGLNEFTGVSSSYLLIKSDYINNSKTEYCYFPESSYVDIQSSDPICDLGYKYNGGDLKTNHLEQDFIVNDNEKLYVRSTLGENYNSDYILCVFCNGELLPLLNDECFVAFNTQNGSKVLNYCLDTEYMSESLGEYSMYAVALPTYEAVKNGETNIYCTKKNRIIFE